MRLTTNQLIQNAMLMRHEILKRFAEQGSRDLNEECGYVDVVDAKISKEMWQRMGIAKRIISLYPEECWQVDPEVYEQEDPEETAFEKAWNSLVKQHNLFHYFQRADEMSGIGHFGIMLLGFDDGGNLDQPVAGIPEDWLPQSFSTPTSETTNTPDVEVVATDGSPATQRKLLYVRVFDENDVEIVSFQEDEKNPRFGQPIFYNITFQDVKAGANGSRASIKRKVHWTRVIHLADNRSSSETYGTPRLEHTMNNITDLRKILGADAEGWWKGGFPGISIETQPGVENPDFDEDQQRAVKEQVEKYQNKLQRYLALVGLSAKSLSPQVGDPRPHFEIQLQCIAIALGCPLRIFLGSEEAKLASTTDKKTWNGRLARRQNTYLTPCVVRPFVDRLIAAKVLPTPKEYFVHWPELGAPSGIEKAEEAAKVVEALAKYVAGGVDVLIPPQEFLHMIMRFDLEEVLAMLEAAADRVSDMADEKDLPGREPKTATDVEREQIELESARKTLEEPPAGANGRSQPAGAR